MEPVSIAIMGTVVFGVTVSFAVFVRQLLLSRDQRLNEKAQDRALEKEVKALEQMRARMESTSRFDSHYKLLDSNKDDIQYLDREIDQLLEKKFTLVKRYSDLALKESSQIIHGQSQEARKIILDKLRTEIDKEITKFDQQIDQMQQRRASIWDTHLHMQSYLIQQEQSRNASLDELYKRHSSILEKIYLRNIQQAELVSVKSIDSGAEAISLIVEPLRLLLQFFQILPNISPNQAEQEITWREQVGEYEDDLNSDIDEDDESLEKLPDWENNRDRGYGSDNYQIEYDHKSALEFT